MIAGDSEEILKLRVQATPEEIRGFGKFLERCEELGMCQVMNFSEMFSNKGTKKYYRAYTDVKLTK